MQPLKSKVRFFVILTNVFSILAAVVVFINDNKGSIPKEFE